MHLVKYLHTKAGSVSSLHWNISAGPILANSTVAVFPLTVTPPLIKWVVQKEGSELISNLLSITRSSLLLAAATRSTYLPGSRSVNDTLPEEPEWDGRWKFKQSEIPLEVLSYLTIADTASLLINNHYYHADKTLVTGYYDVVIID